MKLAIRNVKLLNPAGVSFERGTIVLSAGKVACLMDAARGEPDLPLAEIERVIDGSGLTAAPGLVDMHVHFRDPGYTHKEDVATGSAAAAKGGFTSVAVMPNTNPVCDSVRVVKYLKNKAMWDAPIHVYPIAAVSLGEKSEILSDFAALAQAGAVAFSDDGMPVRSAALMRKAMLAAQKLGRPIISHCEEPSLAGGVMSAGETARRLGLAEIPQSTESIMVAREIALAADSGAPVHIAHVSTAISLAFIRMAKQLGLAVTCETCPHYFTLCDEDVAKYGVNAKMNPPLAGRDDRQAVIKALADGTIDAIVTDHAPHADNEKNKGLAVAPNGIIGLESSFALGMTKLVEPGYLSLAQLVEKMSTTPAKLLGIDAGVLREGGPADLILFDEACRWTFSPADICSKSRNTPFIGTKLRGRVFWTICEGKIVMEDGALV